MVIEWVKVLDDVGPLCHWQCFVLVVLEFVIFIEHCFAEWPPPSPPASVLSFLPSSFWAASSYFANNCFISHLQINAQLSWNNLITIITIHPIPSIQNRYVALETPSRPPPLLGKYHLKFPFWLSAPVPYILCDISLSLMACDPFPLSSNYFPSAKLAESKV